MANVLHYWIGGSLIYSNRNHNRKHDTFEEPKKKKKKGVWHIRVGYNWVLGSNNHFYCFLPWEIKNHINKKKARSCETGVVRKIMDTAYTSVWPLNQAECVTHFQLFPFKYRGLRPSPGLLYVKLSYRSGPNQGGSLPILSSNPADVSAGPSHVPVLLLANTRQLQQTLE